MCFSATASFAASAALLPAGAYCVCTAARKNGAFLALAVVPFVFAAQQFTEGLVWRGLENDDAVLIETASAFYLFFAMAFWPFWIPFSFVFAESRAKVRWLFVAMTAVSLAWTLLYLPIAIDPHRWVVTSLVGHSIRYDAAALPGIAVMPRPVWLAGYAVLVTVPVIVGQGRSMPGRGSKAVNLIGAALLVGSFAITYFLFWQVFTSVWCFFAALLSTFLCYVFYRMPATRDALEGVGAPTFRRAQSSLR
jgi:hypothetical protein